MKPIARLQRVSVALAAVVMGLSFTGCGKDEPEAAPVQVQPAADPNAGQVGVTPAATPPPIDVAAPPPLSAAPAATTGAPEVEVASKDALEVVTQAAQSFFIAKERAPQSLEELVSSGFLRKLPAPPAGKKYVYDPAVASLTLADK